MEDHDSLLPPTERFTKRVAYYVQYRPRYPLAIIPFLEAAVGLTTDTVVADVGAGTGFLAELFLNQGNVVFAVEPNDDMRSVAETRFGDLPNFHSVPATAEATELPAESIDLVTAGQAFHWFDARKARAEFKRILRPDGHVALVYNSWNLPNSSVADTYRALVDRYGVDYKRVTCQKRIGPDMARFFGGDGPGEERFKNDQTYDFDALCGRVLSSSYAPLPGHPSYEPLVAGLRRLFDQLSVDGRLVFPYETTVFWGKLA